MTESAQADLIQSTKAYAGSDQFGTLRLRSLSKHANELRAPLYSYVKVLPGCLCVDIIIRLGTGDETGGLPDGCDRCLQTLEFDCRTGKWEKARATSLCCAPAGRSGYAPGRKDYKALGLDGTGKWICSAMATFWGKSMLPHLEFESCLILPFF